MVPTRLAALMLALSSSLVQSAPQPPAVHISARVVDAATGGAVPDAVLTVAARTVRSDSRGAFAIDAAPDGAVHARAAGYLRTDVAVSALRGSEAAIRLTPFRPKALYLSAYGIGDRRLRHAALDLIGAAKANALVIDVKGDRGLIPYHSDIGLAATLGAQRVITIGHLSELVDGLRAKGIYTIARIVVFKDTLLAQGRPDLAIRRQDGSVYLDREGLAWTNPYSQDVWRYNIGIAVEAARAGFDEIQFDYVRLPDTTGLAYEMPWTEANREAAIDGFLTKARDALAPFNVFLAADVFGYTCWNTDDTKIGQKLAHLGSIVDYLSPMLYPSGFQFGIPGYRNPVEHPYQIVRLSIEEARRRTGLPAVRFRPWLQAFRDYAFGGRPFTAEDVGRQTSAADDVGADGWMLWNPRNDYSAAFKP